MSKEGKKYLAVTRLYYRCPGSKWVNVPTLTEEEIEKYHAKGQYCSGGKKFKGTHWIEIECGAVTAASHDWTHSVVEKKKTTTNAEGDTVEKVTHHNQWMCHKCQGNWKGKRGGGRMVA